MDTKLQIYESICSEVKKCKKCDLGCELVDGHDPHVVGQGNLNAKVCFIAQCPGANEVLLGRPLTPPGLSGKIYEKVLSALRLTRDEVYTTNTVLCRPVANRDPEPWEVCKCSPYLRQQLDLIKPKIVVTFGRFAAQFFLNGFKITRDHGRLCKSAEYGLNIFPLYHPSFVGAYAKEAQRAEFKQDVKKLKKILEEYDGMLE